MIRPHGDVARPQGVPRGFVGTVFPVTRCRHCDDPIEYVARPNDDRSRWLHVRTGRLVCGPTFVTVAEPRYR